MFHVVVCSAFDVNEVSNDISKENCRAFSLPEAAITDALWATVTFSVGNAGDEYTSRFVLLKFPSTSERNAFVTGLRSLTQLLCLQSPM